MGKTIDLRWFFCVLSPLKFIPKNFKADCFVIFLQ